MVHTHGVGGGLTGSFVGQGGGWSIYRHKRALRTGVVVVGRLVHDEAVGRALLAGATWL